MVDSDRSGFDHLCKKAPRQISPGVLSSQLHSYFNHIGVRSFILPGAPFTNKTANTRLWAPNRQDGLLRGLIPTDCADFQFTGSQRNALARVSPLLGPG